MDIMEPTLTGLPIRRYGINEEGRIFMLEDGQSDDLAYFANLEDHRALLREREALLAENERVRAERERFRKLNLSRAAEYAKIELERDELAVRLAWSETARRCSELAAREAEQQRDELAGVLLRIREEVLASLDTEEAAKDVAFGDCENAAEHAHTIHALDRIDLEPATDPLRRLGRLA